MSIKREDLDAGRIDLTEVMTGADFLPFIRGRFFAPISSSQ